MVVPKRGLMRAWKSLSCVALCLLVCVASGYSTALLPRYLPESLAADTRPDPPEFTFSREPISLLTSYWDYLIGGEHTLPLRVVPQSAGGGYFLTFLEKHTPTSYPRAFCAYLNATGILDVCVGINSYQAQEGWSALAVDPVSGKPLYAWQRDGDSDTDADICSSSDAFISGIAGLLNDYTVAIANPVSITAPAGGTTTDNVFLAPQIAIGPSPFANKRRAYIAGTNTVGHNSQSQNLYIAFRDFNADDIETGAVPTWNHVSIPELDGWNAGGLSRSLHLSLAADQSGNLYAGGYLSDDANPQEADLMLFKCDNFGQGTWSRISGLSHLPAWNPARAPDDSTGYFTNANHIPYADAELYWGLMNSGHLNLTCDTQNKLRIAGLWALCTTDGAYYPDLQFPKLLVWDSATGQYQFKEIYPAKAGANSSDLFYQPWDNEAPWGVVDAWETVGDLTQPVMTKAWPFPHWDASAHGDAMMDQYNSLKITEVNPQGMLAAVWQDSRRARLYNYQQDTDYVQYANTPEIRVSVSSDSGATWSQPLVLNNVSTPQLAGIKPMWVYPADQVKFVGYSGNGTVGKLGLLFYNDYTWGANSLTPPYHNNVDGGQVMFMELQINFPAPAYELSAPMLTPLPGSWNGPIHLFLSVDQPGADIRYTLNGSEPTETSTLYTAPLWLSPGYTLVRARAFQTGQTPSGITNGEYILTGVLPETAFSPTPGLYTQFVNLVMSTYPIAQVPIRYTTDGSDPDSLSWQYTQPVPLHSGTYTIKARSYLPGWPESPITAGDYLITGTLMAPTFQPPGGTYHDTLAVTISTSDPLAEIHFSTDGSAPDQNSPLYTEPLQISQPTVVHARAYRENWAPSQIATAAYDMVVANPQDEAVPGFTGFGKVYPNPFRSSARIELGIEGGRKVWALQIFNLRGELLLTRSGSGSGSFFLDWDGRDSSGSKLPCGIYLARFTAGETRQTRKLMLIGD